MAFSLANLAEIGPAIGGAMPGAEMDWMRVLEARQRLQDQQRQQQAQAAWLQSLLSPAEAALPQQGAPPSGMPPQASPAQLQTQPAPFGQRPTDAALSAPAVGSSPAAATATPPGPTPGGATPSPTGPAAGGAPLSMPDPISRLRRMAQQIKAANPGLDNLTLAYALKQQVDMAHNLAPDDRAILQAETRVMQIEAQGQNAIMKANNATEIAQIKAQSAEEMKNIWAGIATRGQDLQHQDRQTAEQGRMTRAQLAADTRKALSEASAAGVKPTIDDVAAERLARAWIKGDRTVVQGLGYGKLGAANRAFVLNKIGDLAQQEGLEGEDLAAARVDFMGAQAGARTAATQGTRIDIAARELDKFTGPVLAASRAVDRTKYPDWNAVVMSAQRRTGDTNVIKLVTSVNALKNAYAQIAARGGQSTDDARRRADEVINAAWSQGQIEAGLEQLKIEASKALEATTEVRRSATDTIRARPGGGTPAAPSAAPSGGDTGGWSIRPVQ